MRIGRFNKLIKELSFGHLQFLCLYFTQRMAALSRRCGFRSTFCEQILDLVEQYLCGQVSWETVRSVFGDNSELNKRRRENMERIFDAVSEGERWVPEKEPTFPLWLEQNLMDGIGNLIMVARHPDVALRHIFPHYNDMYLASFNETRDKEDIMAEIFEAERIEDEIKMILSFTGEFDAGSFAYNLRQSKDQKAVKAYQEELEEALFE